jgi:hypothetical protein
LRRVKKARSVGMGEIPGERLENIEPHRAAMRGQKETHRIFSFRETEGQVIFARF